jgi:hypothetical protein
MSGDWHQEHEDGDHMTSLVIAINALDHHGKTTMLLTAPKPLDIFAIDPNTTEIVEGSGYDEDDVKLNLVTYPATVFSNKDQLQDEAERAWRDEFIEPLRDSIETKSVKSIGLDTATELFELLLMADHGKTVQILPELRTKTNYKFKGLLQALKRSGKHIVLLHRLRDVWRSEWVETNKGREEKREKVVGVYEREGFSKTGFHVNAEVYLRFKPERGGSLSNQFGVRLGGATARPGLITARSDSDKFWLDEDGWYWGKQRESGKVRPYASIPAIGSLLYPDEKLWSLNGKER